MVKKILLSLIGVLVFTVGAFAQTKQVRGSVVDENGAAVVGASVIVKGTTIGVSTDQQGFFVMNNVPAKSEELQISYLGYVTQDVKIRPNMQIALVPDEQTIESVVVTGMTKTDKRLFTGAADRLSADDVKLSGMADISRGLEGRSAGVSVQNVSGTFGTAPKIRVRGATSIHGSSKPLWVVDGVIMEDVADISAEDLSSGDATTLIGSAIAGLNAEDIESFNILKDGSATSIYGARAMAGVIVITTKKGRAGVSRINYTGEFTYRMIPSYADFNIMNSQDQMSVYQELYNKGWLGNSRVTNASASGVYGKMYSLINAGLLENTTEARNRYLRKAEYRNTDWFKELFQNTVMHSHSVSITSGTEKSAYYASISALFDPGWTKASEVERYTANLNATYNISDALTLNLITNGSYRKQKAPGTLGATTDYVTGEVKRDFDINPYSYALNTSRVLDPKEYYIRNYADFNILHELANNYIDLNVADVKFQGELKWKAFKGFEASALASVRYTGTSQEHNVREASNQANAYRAMGTTTIRDNNPLLYKDPDDIYAVPVSILPAGGIYTRTDNRLLSYDFRFSATYNTTINNTHIINAYLGMETNQSDRQKTWFRGWGLQYDSGEIPFYDYLVFKKGKEDNSPYYEMENTYYRNVAFFFNGTYSYKGRYTVNGTLRYEGNNALGLTTRSRWLPTWNISGAWNVHEENFFNSISKAVSHLSLKASYSLTADRPSVTNALAVIQSYSPWRPSAGVTESGLTIQDLENSDLTYEKKHELNIGADLGFLDNRINLTVDWYKRNNFDLIGLVMTQGIGGQIQKYGNVATMKSWGIEFSLSTKNIKTKDFSWTTDFIYSHMKNEVTKFNTSTRAFNLVSGIGFSREGYPVNSLFSYDFRGLNEDGIPTFINEAGELTSTDINFQETERFDNLIYSGPSEPTDVGSFGNIFQYKGLRLNVFITYSFGNVVRLDPVFSSTYNDLDAMPREFRNRWMTPGDEKYTDIPAIVSSRQVRNDSKLSYAYNAYNYSTARIAKGDFIRMKEISLTYDFPKRWIKKLRMSNLALKIQATNLFLIYADKKLNGQDPEFFNSGGVATPVPKQFTLTLKIGL
ncbi:MAG: SusC/RagA family TonB-linked outer membrane protein [Alistipes sp.]|uniref:SusC/RagA family TonB-linked outer membrane protein n=1 Tax=Alistipes sp. TaxID=1872444 RepID=UPI0025C33BDA|nr:SusC/RagA family TonB-linked outer membrane protein [Alistipes sp.]MCD8275595.1 SusC/RagA family TonB-linked outer membrane protein [Alistipes sp.]